MLVLSHMTLFVMPWTVARQIPLSMEFYQERILEWVAISFSRGSSRPRGRTQVFWVSCLGKQVLYHCTTCEAQEFMYDDDQIIFTNGQPLVFLYIDVFKRTS